MRQNAMLYQLMLASGETEHVTIRPGRKVYIHLISGELTLLGQRLQAGDGIKIADETELSLIAQGAVKALLFDLP